MSVTGNIGGTVAITSSFFVENLAGNGGGIFFQAIGANVIVNLYNCTIASNFATDSAETKYGQGGGLFITDGGPSFKHVTIAHNNASKVGGGLFISGGNTNMEDCKITHNRVLLQLGGAGIGAYYGSRFRIMSTFFADNASPGGFFDIRMTRLATQENGRPLLLNNVYGQAKQLLSGDFQYCSSRLCKTWNLGSPGGVECANREGNRGVTCSHCLPGNFLSANASSYRCFECVPGQYANRSGLSKCMQCPLGQFQNSLGKSACKMCPFGTYAIASGFTCISIPPGYYGTGCNSVQTGCQHIKPCPEEFYCLGNTSTLPQRCADGKTSSLGSSTCFSCPIGKAGRNGKCTECPGNSVSEHTGAKFCTPCKLNKVATAKKSYCVVRSERDGLLPKIESVRRLRGNRMNVLWSMNGSDSVDKVTNISLVVYDYMSGREVRLQEFPPTSKSLSTEKLPMALEDRVYRVSIRLYFQNNSMSRTSSAEYRNNIWKQTSDCTDLQYLDDSEGFEKWSCKPCPTGASCTGRITWAGVKARFGYWRFKRRFYKCAVPDACLGAPNKESLYTKYADNYDRNESCNRFVVQGSRLCSTCARGFARGSLPGSCSLCHGFAIDVTLLVVYGTVSTLFTFVLVRVTVFKPPAEFHFSTGVKKSIISYLQFAHLASELQVPWSQVFQTLFAYQARSVSVGTALFSLNCAVQTLGTWAAYKIKLYIAAALPIVCVPVAYIVMKVGKGSLVHFKAALVLLLYLLYTSLIAVFAKIFSCRSIGELKYLQIDPEVICWQGNHLQTAIVAGVISVIYVVGLPLLGLWCIRNADLSSPNSQVIYGILREGYMDSKWWWEAVVVTRKLFVVLISIFLTTYQQLLGALLCVLLSLYATAFARPFDDDRLHLIEYSCLATSFLTYWGGAFLLVDSSSPIGNVIGIIVVLLNIFGLLYLLLLFTVTYWDETGKEIVQSGIHTGRKKIDLGRQTLGNVCGKVRKCMSALLTTINRCRCCEHSNDRSEHRARRSTRTRCRNSWAVRNENQSVAKTSEQVSLQSLELQIENKKH
jgi:hypothetical protein